MNSETIINELTFKAIRSSGSGGQHVNKTSSKVEVTFAVFTSEGLTEIEKECLARTLVSKITKDGNLILTASDSRSQHKNKAIVIDKLLKLLKEKTKVSRPRKKTKPSRSSVEKRIQSKKNNASKKANRKPPQIN